MSDAHGGDMTTTTHIHSRCSTDQNGSIASFASRLDAEWASLRTSRRALSGARRWSIVSELTDLDQIVAATQRTSSRTDDVVLLRLVELARADELAGRVVLQHLLPALIRYSTPYRSFRDQIDPVEIIVPTAWLAIRSYDVERRTHDVASSLLSDAVYRAFRQPLRRRAATEELWPVRRFAAVTIEDDPATPLDELAVVIRDARNAGVDGCDIDLLRHLVRTGSPSRVAAERNVTPRTIRNHRDRAIHHVRTALALPVAA